MKAVVVDASMAAAWTLDDERSAAGDRILEEVRTHFPVTLPLFWYEYRSVLLMRHRRKGLSRESITDLIKAVSAIGIEELKVDDHEAIFSLAFQYDLSAYDAAYLALAIELKGILATNDRQLVLAARAAGVDVRTTLDKVAGRTT